MKKLIVVSLASVTLLASFSVSAVTITNKNSQNVHYNIYTNGFLTKCTEGSLSANGGSVTWTTSSLSLLCNNPKHVEVDVTGVTNPIPVNCTHNGDTQFTNKGTKLTVTNNGTGKGVSCKG